MNNNKLNTGLKDMYENTISLGDNMSIRTKLEDMGIDTDEKEMYELAKFIWKEAQKELLEEMMEEINNLEIKKGTPHNIIHIESYNIGCSDCWTLLKNKSL